MSTFECPLLFYHHSKNFLKANQEHLLAPHIPYSPTQRILSPLHPNDFSVSKTASACASAVNLYREAAVRVAAWFYARLLRAAVHTCAAARNRFSVYDELADLFVTGGALEELDHLLRGAGLFI